MGINYYSGGHYFFGIWVEKPKKKPGWYVVSCYNPSTEAVAVRYKNAPGALYHKEKKLRDGEKAWVFPEFALEGAIRRLIKKGEIMKWG